MADVMCLYLDDLVEVLDGVPSGMWALCQGVFDNVGPYNDWVEHPAVGLIPA